MEPFGTPLICFVHDSPVDLSPLTPETEKSSDGGKLVEPGREGLGWVLGGVHLSRSWAAACRSLLPDAHARRCLPALLHHPLAPSWNPRHRLLLLFRISSLRLRGSTLIAEWPRSGAAHPPCAASVQKEQLAPTGCTGLGVSPVTTECGIVLCPWCSRRLFFLVPTSVTVCAVALAVLLLIVRIYQRLVVQETKRAGDATPAPYCHSWTSAFSAKIPHVDTSAMDSGIRSRCNEVGAWDRHGMHADGGARVRPALLYFSSPYPRAIPLRPSSSTAGSSIPYRASSPFHTLLAR